MQYQSASTMILCTVILILLSLDTIVPEVVTKENNGGILALNRVIDNWIAKLESSFEEINEMVELFIHMTYHISADLQTWRDEKNNMITMSHLLQKSALNTIQGLRSKIPQINGTDISHVKSQFKLVAAYLSEIKSSTGPSRTKLINNCKTTRNSLEEVKSLDFLIGNELPDTEAEITPGVAYSFFDLWTLVKDS